MAKETSEIEVIIRVPNTTAGQKQVTSLANAFNALEGNTKKSSKAQAEQDYKLNQGVIGSANATKSFSKLSQTIGSGPNGLVGAYATLAANAFAVSAAFNVLRSASQATQLLQGLEVQGNKTGRTLSIVTQSIKQITEGALSNADAMRAVAQGNAAGLMASDIEKLTQVATNASKVLGRNLPDSMERIIKGVTKLEPELLDELGLMTKLTEASEKYARAKGKAVSALTGADKRRAFVDAIQAEGDLKFGGVEGQIDTNVYDKLAAKFQDTTQAALSTASSITGLNAVVSVLADNTAVMLGAMTLFVSMVSKPTTTYFAKMAADSHEASTQLAKDAAKQAKLADEIAEKRQAASANIVGNISDAGGLDVNGPNKAFTKLNDAVASGSLDTTKERSAALKELEDREKSLQTTIEHKNKTLERYKGIQDQLNKDQLKYQEIATRVIANNKEELTAITLRREAILALAEAEQEESEAKKSQLLASATANISTAQAEKQAGLSDLVSGAQELDLPKTIKGYKEAFKGFKEELKANIEAVRTNSGAITSWQGRLAASIPGLSGLRLGLFAVTTGIKAMGIALMSALPIIGLAIEAWGLLTYAYDNWWKSEEDKAKEKALESFNEVLEQTLNHLKEANRIEASNQSASDKAYNTTLIRANSLAELADAYLKIGEAAETARKKEAAREAVKYKRGNGYNISVQYDLDIDSITNQTVGQSKALAIGASWTRSYTDEQKALVNSLQALEEISPSAAKEMQVVVATAQDFDSVQAAVNAKMRQLKSISQQASDSLTDYSTSMKALEQIQTDFNKSLISTTIYDQLDAGLTSAVGSVIILNASLQSLQGNQEGLEKFSAIITGLGRAASSNLSEGTQREIEAVKELTVRLQEVKEAKKEAQSAGNSNLAAAYTQQETSLLEERKQLMIDLAPKIKEELLVAQQRVAQYRTQAIIQESLIAYAQAYSSYIQKQGTIVGDNIRRQDAAANRVIQMQIQELAGKKLLLGMQQQQLLLEQKISEERAASTKSAHEAELSMLKMEQERLKGQAQTPLVTRELASVNQRVELGKQVLKQDEAQAEVAKLTNELAKRGIEASKKNLDIKQQALALGLISGQETDLKAAQQDFKAKQDILAVTKAQRDIDDSNLQNRAEYLRWTRGIGTELGNNLAAEERSYQTKRQALQEEQDAIVKNLQFEKLLAQARGGPASQLAQYDQLIAAQNSLYDSKYRELDVQYKLNVAKQIGYENDEARLTAIQDSYSYLEKSLEAQRSLAELRQDYRATAIDLDAKRRGVTDTEATNRRKEIDAANTAYELARQEVEMKVALIKLEYALLAAKRADALATLKVQEQALTAQKAQEEATRKEKKKYQDLVAPAESFDLATGTQGIVSVGKETTSTTDANLAANQAVQRNLESVDFSTAVNAGIEALLLNLSNLALKSQAAKTTGPLVTNSFSSDFANAQERRSAFGASLGTVEGGIGVEPETIDLVKYSMQELQVQTDKFVASMSALGPDGAVAAAAVSGMQNVMNSMTDFGKVMQESHTNTQAWVAGLQVASQALSMIQSVVASTATAKQAAVDKEIAAETARDGKSAASVEKLNQMNKKKDDIARKSFNTQKKLMMAQAVISTAAAVAATLAIPAFGAQIPLAVAIGALGLAQVALIAGTSYESSYTPQTVNTGSLSIGSTSAAQGVNLASGANANAGGESAYVRGSSGYGSNASNYRTVGSAYGGELNRGYGSRGFVVGEKGPEIISPETPITVTPANQSVTEQPVQANVTIQAWDGEDVTRVLSGQTGNLIKLIRGAANASGQKFLEDVNTNVYIRPSVSKI